MTKQDERLAFLTSQENLPIVLEILQEGDRIRSLLFNRFIAALKVYLQDHTTMPQHECELTVQEETEDNFAAVYLRNTTLPRENQYLTYSVQHFAEKTGACELTPMP